jgi:hypothetical protein
MGSRESTHGGVHEQEAGPALAPLGMVVHAEVPGKPKQGRHAAGH